MTPRRVVARRLLPGSPFNVTPAQNPVAQFAVADRVSHDRHGLGTVVGLEQHDVVLVDFGSEVRRIATTSTKLNKL